MPTRTARIAPAPTATYEWSIQIYEDDTYDEVAEIHHYPTAIQAVEDARARRADGDLVQIVLVRDVGGAGHGLKDRQWAYVDENGADPVPVRFSQGYDDGQGAIVPTRYRVAMIEALRLAK